MCIIFYKMEVKIVSYYNLYSLDNLIVNWLIDCMVYVLFL